MKKRMPVIVIVILLLIGSAQAQVHSGEKQQPAVPAPEAPPLAFAGPPRRLVARSEACAANRSQQRSAEEYRKHLAGQPSDARQSHLGAR